MRQKRPAQRCSSRWHGQCHRRGRSPGDGQQGADPTLGPQILRAVTVGEERTFEQDPALALRLLADIALRALSPAVNDPTIAVDAQDWIANLLGVLAIRDLDAGDVADNNGTIRVTLVLPTWDDYLAVALDEIIALPGLLPTVTRRHTRLLDDITATAPSARTAELEKRRAFNHYDPADEPDLRHQLC